MLRHLLIQLLAAVGSWVFIAPAVDPLPWAVLQGLFAALLCYFWRMPGWLKLTHGLFTPAIVVLQQQGVPPWVYLAAFLLTFALGRNAATERVPLYRSSVEAADALASLLPQGCRLLEAGCGDGRLAMLLAARRPDLVICAMENAWGGWLLAKWRWWRAGSPASVSIRCRSFWKEHWGNHDAVYAFLSPEPMPRVWEKFQREGADGSLLVSNTFVVPDVQPDSRIPLGGPLQKALLIWRHPHGTR